VRAILRVGRSALSFLIAVSRQSRPTHSFILSSSEYANSAVLTERIPTRVEPIVTTSTGPQVESSGKVLIPSK
jgi:hypothetical protein